MLTGVSSAAYTPGDRVVVMEPAEVRRTEGKVDDLLPGFVFTVKDVNDKWLWRSGGQPGWVNQKHVTLFDRTAADRFTKLIEVNPTDASLYSSRSEVWIALGEYDLAIADLNEAIRIAPNAAGYHSRLGHAYAAKHLYPLALEAFNRALQLDAKHVDAFSGRGIVQQLRGDSGAAMDDYNMALKLSPQYVPALVSRANLQDAKFRFEKALEDYRLAIKIDPKHGKAYLGSALSYFSLNEIDKALADYDRALKNLDDDREQAIAHYHRGNAHFAKEQYDKAISDFQQALAISKLGSLAAMSYDGLGRSFAAKGENDSAIENFGQAIQINPKDPFYHIGRGYARMANQEPLAAIADFDQAVRLDPQDAWAYVGRAIAKMMSGDKDAVQGFREVIDAQGWEGEFAANAVILGYLCARGQQAPEIANQFLDDAAGKVSNRWPAPLIPLLSGDAGEKEFLALATDERKLTMAHCYLGLAAEFQGQREKAIEHYRWIQDHGNQAVSEFHLAIAKLRRLES